MAQQIQALAGGAFVSLIIFLIQRFDARKEKGSEILKRLDQIEKRIEQLDDKAEKREAVTSRIRILRFNDELQEGRKHSKDSFDQCMSDITNYEKYCNNHPDFKNNQTVATVSYITKVYEERLEKHDFL